MWGGGEEGAGGGGREFIGVRTVDERATAIRRPERGWLIRMVLLQWATSTKLDQTRTVFHRCAGTGPMFNSGPHCPAKGDAAVW